MSYSQKPKMILFDVGGTLFNDGRCNPADGFEKLRHYALNPEVTNGKKLCEYWDKYLGEVSKIKSASGISLDIPLSSVIKYAAMNTGLVFDIPMTAQEEIFDRYNSSRSVIDGIPELLAELDSSGIRTAVISNNMMSGESLALAIKRWIPSARFEFCLTSSDILFTKPSKNIFMTALKYAKLKPSECWYCGDSVIPDIYGSSVCGMTPVLLDVKSSAPLEFRNDEHCSNYLTVNSWSVLKDCISKI
ncbi:MAG: HAD family hydrolase [Ruminococcaceae bacterium]|nr:HAD family hydrolase [Oscillospiraceae bacterium]